MSIYKCVSAKCELQWRQIWREPVVRHGGRQGKWQRPRSNLVYPHHRSPQHRHRYLYKSGGTVLRLCECGRCAVCRAVPVRSAHSSLSSQETDDTRSPEKSIDLDLRVAMSRQPARENRVRISRIQLHFRKNCYSTGRVRKLILFLLQGGYHFKRHNRLIKESQLLQSLF